MFLMLVGLIRPFKGLIRPLTVFIRPFKDLIRLQKGLIRLGLIRPLGALKSPANNANSKLLYISSDIIVAKVVSIIALCTNDSSCSCNSSSGVGSYRTICLLACVCAARTQVTSRCLLRHGFWNSLELQALSSVGRVGPRARHVPLSGALFCSAPPRCMQPCLCPAF